MKGLDMVNPFKRVFKVTIVTSENTMKHVAFIRDYTWGAVTQAMAYAAQKSEDEHKNWVVENIERIK